MPSEYVSRKRRMSLSWRDLCSKTQFAAMNDTSNIALVIRVDDWRISTTSR
jgi:hypothetical protein